MSPTSDSQSPERLKQALKPTAACIPIERFGETLNEREQMHLDTCVRCQTEQSLWREFSEGSSQPETGAAEQWVVAELRRRRAPAAKTRSASGLWGWFRAYGPLPVAATVLLAVAIGYFAWDREPAVHGPQDSQPVYRETQLQVVAPVGELRTAPRDLEWHAVSGAASYDVTVFEADRTELWHASVTAPRASLPPPVAAQLVPGKPVLWEVVARNRAGAIIAESGTQRFRVALE